MARHGLTILASVWMLASSTTVRAQAQYLPRPDEVPPLWSLAVLGSGYVPIDAGSLCPGTFQCVIGGGFGIGVELERRTSDGFGLLVRYDANLLDAGSVFEHAVLHRAGIGLRYTANLHQRLRPTIDAVLAFAVFGEPSPPATVGASVAVSGGAELDLYRSVTLTGKVSLNALSLAPFSTLDGAQRASSFGVTVGATVSVGVQILLSEPSEE